jgi:adenylosuccinate synthase
MPAIVVVGAQWGDEGKGKVVDLIAERADMVVRYAGGANAGHTLQVGNQKVVTHLLPSGVMHPKAACVLGAGMVIDPSVLVSEIDEATRRGLDVVSRLTISSRAHVTLPFLTEIDRAANLGPHSIGTTGRGIGPTYADKAARLGVRLGDVVDANRARQALAPAIEAWGRRARAAGTAEPRMEKVLEWLAPFAPRIAPLLGDASMLVHQAILAKRRVVFEGAQGALLDLDHGTYPFVTSSSTVAGGACTGTGIGPTFIDAVIGISKAYCTRVGNGPFPTELTGPKGDALRDAGDEYGATTGRPRRCGWLDLPALRYAARVNGLTALALTKLDILSGYERIPVCVEYELDGHRMLDLPIDRLDAARPVYREAPGWREPLSTARTLGSLPAAARDYVQMIAREVGVPVYLVSVGAEREATIELEDPFQLAARRGRD